MSETDKAIAKVIESSGKVAPEIWADIVAAERVEAIAAIVMLVTFSFVLAKLARFFHKEGDAQEFVWMSSALALFLLFCAAMWLDDALYPTASAIHSVMRK